MTLSSPTSTPTTGKHTLGTTMKKTQKQLVIDRLLAKGYVTRNEMLLERITRLGAIIQELEVEGFVFEARYGTKNKHDYGYILKSCPFQRVTYTVGGKEITTYKR